jgi:membrane fusion protein (multidrug efflux system)
VVVTTLVLVATVVGLGVGTLWAVYRWQHTVISNAAVKGRVNKVGARLDGQVKSVEVVPAQRVRKGDVLLRLEDDFYQANVRQAESELQSASKLYEAEKLFIDHERRRIAVEIERTGGLCSAAGADVEVAISERVKWDRESERLKNLIASGISSASETDSVTAQRDGAAAKLKVAQGKQAAAESDCRAAALLMDGLRVREAGLEVLKANIERDRQKLSAAQADLNATVIRASEDGWVIDSIVEPGGSAKVGEPLLSLWLGAPWVEAWVDEKHLAKIKVGSAVDVTLTAYRGQKLRGQVEAIGVLADKELQAMPVPPTLHALFTDNAMIPIRIAVSSDRHRLQPGLTALVGIRNARTDVRPPAVASRGETKSPPEATARPGEIPVFPKSKSP